MENQKIATQATAAQVKAPAEAHAEVVEAPAKAKQAGIITKVT
jgi:hypothetical protein